MSALGLYPNMTRVFLFIFIFCLLTFLTAIIANSVKIDNPRTSVLLSYITKVVHREELIGNKGQKYCRIFIIFLIFKFAVCHLGFFKKNSSPRLFICFPKIYVC